MGPHFSTGTWITDRNSHLSTEVCWHVAKFLGHHAGTNSFQLKEKKRKKPQKRVMKKETYSLVTEERSGTERKVLTALNEMTTLIHANSSDIAKIKSGCHIFYHCK